MDNKEQLTIKHLTPYYQHDLYGYASTCELKGKLVGMHGIEYLTLSHSINDHNTVNSSYQVSEFKPLLRNLPDLTKEIEVNGERFVPIVELFKMLPSSNYVDYRGNFKYPQFQIDDEWNHCLSYETKQQDTLCFSFDSNSNSFMLMVNETIEFVSNQLALFQKLYEWHFAIDIPSHLYIDLNTLQK